MEDGTSLVQSRRVTLQVWFREAILEKGDTHTALIYGHKLVKGLIVLEVLIRIQSDLSR